MSKFCVLIRRGFAAILCVLQEIAAARMELAQGTEADIRTQNLRKVPQLNYVVLSPKKACNLTEYPV